MRVPEDRDVVDHAKVDERSRAITRRKELEPHVNGALTAPHAGCKLADAKQRRVADSLDRFYERLEFDDERNARAHGPSDYPSAPPHSCGGVCAIAIVLLAITGGYIAVTPAVARAAEINITGNALGADVCVDPSVAHLQTWYDASPYAFYGIYMGGDEMGCHPQPNLSASYVNAITTGTQYWALAPLWVGPQAPCTSYANTFSYNTSDAHSQGYSQAQDAYNTDVSLGMGSRVPMNYDLEASDNSNASCVAAARAFVSGWSAFFVYSGVYGSVVGSALTPYASSSPVPQHIWGAYPDGNPDTSDMDNSASGLSGLWVETQRLKQYTTPENVTWGGLTMNVGLDSVDGPAYAYPPS